MKANDFLVELHTEELPPKALLKLATAFKNGIVAGIQKEKLNFGEVVQYATPRRLAVLVKDLDASQPDQNVERRGPAVKAAFDADGNPTKACQGFARGLGIDPKDLSRLKTDQGEYVAYKQHVTGKAVAELMPAIVKQSANQLPIPKRMHWGDSDVEFVRPVHAVVMLYGKDVIDAEILGCKTDRKTRGHRFMSPKWLSISKADDYEDTLESKGNVIVDFDKRRAEIVKQAKKLLSVEQHVLMDEALLVEVTGLVEWPEAFLGKYDEAFLSVPKEVLISAMQDHQRYFPLATKDESKLLPGFVGVSNIKSKNAKQMAHGNERVLRARLADAAFFYEADQKETLEQRLEHLKGMVFQAKLGTLYERAERLSSLTGWIAGKMGVNVEAATRAGLLAKADLTTDLVGEFTELQGVMGGYYAKADGEGNEVAHAIGEQYMPVSSRAALPSHALGQALAIADRADLLVGSFGIGKVPTGDKDPYGLRRAAVGIIRIIIENKLDIDLADLFADAVSGFADKLSNADIVPQLMTFVQDRMRALYQEQGVTPDVFAAVSALPLTNLLDIDARIKAVQAFKKLSEAENLAAANKRVSNILSKYSNSIELKQIDPAQFEHDAEKVLVAQLENKRKLLAQTTEYDKVLLQLADLRTPIDDFFEHVMVMSDDPKKRDNRLLILKQIRELFLQVADIALLQ